MRRKTTNEQYFRCISKQSYLQRVNSNMEWHLNNIHAITTYFNTLLIGFHAARTRAGLTLTSFRSRCENSNNWRTETALLQQTCVWVHVHISLMYVLSKRMNLHSCVGELFLRVVFLSKPKWNTNLHRKILSCSHELQ